MVSRITEYPQFYLKRQDDDINRSVPVSCRLCEKWAVSEHHLWLSMAAAPHDVGLEAPDGEAAEEGENCIQQRAGRDFGASVPEDTLSWYFRKRGVGP